jgi:hypothetical protein
MIDPLRAVELYDELGAALGGGACALMILCGIAFAVRDAAALARKRFRARSIRAHLIRRSEGD